MSGRLNVVTQGLAGKGNTVLNIGLGKLSLTDSFLPIRLHVEAKQDAMIFYAMLYGELTGPLLSPSLLFHPGSLLRSSGRLSDTVNIDEIRWPLAGVTLTAQGVNGRLQAILSAHESEIVNFTLHLDGQAKNFLPDNGEWIWRYWGSGKFVPMSATWDIAGRGDWHDTTIKIDQLSTGFDRLKYGTMLVKSPRMALDTPVKWVRDVTNLSLSGELKPQADASGVSAVAPTGLEADTKLSIAALAATSVP